MASGKLCKGGLAEDFQKTKFKFFCLKCIIYVICDLFLLSVQLLFKKIYYHNYLQCSILKESVKSGDIFWDSRAERKEQLEWKKAENI